MIFSDMNEKIVGLIFLFAYATIPFQEVDFVEILSFLEYQNSTNSTNVEDYLQYLEGNLQELNDTLIKAKDLHLDEDICYDLQKQIIFITGLIKLTENKLFTCILNTIDSLSISELLPFYVGIKESDLVKRKQAKDMLDKLEKKLAVEREMQEKELRMQGLDEVLYQKEDTFLFFKELLPISTYIDTLILDDEVTEQILKEKMKTVCDTLIDSQKIKLEYATEDIINEIVSVMTQYRIIASKLTNKDKLSFFSPLLSNERILRLCSQEEVEMMFYHMQVLFKMDTNFFRELPENLKTELLKENFAGSCYEKLKGNYENILNQRPFSLPTSEKIVELETSIYEIKDQLLAFDKRVDKENAIRNDVVTLREYVKDKFERLEMGIDTLEIHKMQEICKRKEKMDTLREEVQKETKDIIRLEEILEDSSYYCFFDTTSAKIQKRIWDAVCGVFATELVIKPYLDVEEKRYKQIDILYDGQKKLSQLEAEIHVLEGKPFANLSRKNKRKIEELKRRYQTTMEECYNQLKQQNLLIVETPEVLYTSTFDNIELANRKNPYPHNFDDLSKLTSVLWNINPSIPEIKTIADYRKEGIEDYICDVGTRYRRLFEKLFSYEKRGPEQFFYTFSITEPEMKELRTCQEEIINLVRAIYEGRREERKRVKYLAESYLDETKMNELISLGISECNMTKENVKQTILRKKENKERVEAELGEMELLQLESQKYLPNGISLEAIMQYQQMLLGIDACSVSLERIENCYSRKTKIYR